VNDGEALLQAILADPSDDILRLVYADWLDEVGEADRAAFIRVQMELVHAKSASLTALEQRLLGPVEDRVWQRRREWALPATLQKQWPLDAGGWEWCRGFPEVWHCQLTLWEAHGTALVASVPVRRVVLIDRQPRPTPSHPRAPQWTWFRDEEGWVQAPDESCRLPRALFDLLETDPLDFAMFDHARTYQTRADALSALSDACLRLVTPVRAS